MRTVGKCCLWLTVTMLCICSLPSLLSPIASTALWFWLFWDVI